MASNSIQDLWNLLFNSFTSEIFLDVSDSFDLDINFFNSVPKKLTKNFTVDNITLKLNSSEKDVLSILYLNTRSLSKNFERLKTLLAEFCNL